MSNDFIPSDTENSFYVLTGATIGDIVEAANHKWGDISIDDLNIEAEYVHCRCLGYDLYDSADYDNYLCVTLLESE